MKLKLSLETTFIPYSDVVQDARAKYPKGKKWLEILEIRAGCMHLRRLASTFCVLSPPPRLGPNIHWIHSFCSSNNHLDWNEPRLKTNLIKLNIMHLVSLLNIHKTFLCLHFNAFIHSFIRSSSALSSRAELSLIPKPFHSTVEIPKLMVKRSLNPCPSSALMCYTLSSTNSSCPLSVSSFCVRSSVRFRWGFELPKEEKDKQRTGKWKRITQNIY